MAAITASCAALRPASVRVSAPRPARSSTRVVLAAAKTEVSVLELERAIVMIERQRSVVTCLGRLCHAWL